MVPCIFVQDGIHLTLRGAPVAISKGDKHFQEVMDVLKAGGEEADVQAIIDREKDRITRATQLTPNISVKAGELFYQNEPIHNTLSARMLSMLDEGFDLAPMSQFLENLMQNPSFRVVNHLYAFLEKGKNAITADGHFLAYKAVREDFKDIHSGTFDNSVGQKVSIPRRKVDENPDRTCSYGLHVCSFDYLPYFAHANGHVVICKVNPADVVAIPSDYNNTKMRVCAYEVVGEYEGYYKAEGDMLAETTVLNGDGSESDYPFEVSVTRGMGDSGREVVGNFKRLAEAAQHAEGEDENTVFEVIIRNRINDMELQRTRNSQYDGDSFDYEVDGDPFVLRILDDAGDVVRELETYEFLSEAKAAALEVEFDAGQKLVVYNKATDTVELTLS